MPQMAPLNWLTLMTLFSATLLIFNMMNYFSFPYKISFKTIEAKKKSINWKW